MPGAEPSRLERDEYGRLVRSGLVLDPVVQVDGVDETGRRIVTFDLDHGADPAASLRALGWEPQLRSAQRHVGDPQGLLLTYGVHEAANGATPIPADEVRVDDGLVLADHPEPLIRRRLAAYAVTTSDAGLLLSQNSDLTNSPGAWALPGGGIDPGEEPVDAVVREIWEETGQDATVHRLEDVVSHRWIGLSPKGVLEDFQALRLIYRATCAQPRTPVVHDVGGTTMAAAWVAFDELESVRFAGSTLDVLNRRRRSS